MLTIDKKKIVFEVRLFVIEYLALSILCIFAMVASWHYHGHIGMIILAIPVSIIYLILFLSKIVKVIIDIYKMDIIYSNFVISTVQRKKFEIMFTKKYSIIEVYNNSTCQNQKKTLVMTNNILIEPKEFVDITYLKRSRMIIKIDRR